MISAIITAFLFIGFRFFMPVKKSIKEVSLSESKFKKTLLFSYLVWILFGLSLSALIYFLLQKAGINSEHEYLYDLYPDTTFWIATSIVSGFSMATMALFAFIKYHLNDTSDEFWALYDTLYKFRASIILRVLAVVLGILGIVLIRLGDNAEFKVYSDKIEVSRLFEMSSKEYPMNQVKEINHRLTLIAPNGNKVNKPHYEIVFKDGYSWSTILDIREPKKSDDEAFLNISENSGVKIIEIN